MLSGKTPIEPGRGAAPHASDPRVIYLAPRCCYDEGTGREWCENNVWPCGDCPDPKRARVAVYHLGSQVMPQSDDPEERGEQ